jgi:ribose/xylose/arabinose/galactoside ABC-type transport system permease subunit
MIRILLPLAVIAAILFAPMYSVQVKDPVLGEQTAAQKSGYAFVDTTIECWKGGNYSVSGDCKPKGGIKGQLIFAAIFVSGVAAVLGVLGIIPIVGRLTSFITTLAGVVVLAAIAYFALTMMGSKDGAESIQWGSYLAGGGGLLTLISGLAGVRGK